MKRGGLKKTVPFGHGDNTLLTQLIQAPLLLLWFLNIKTVENTSA